MLINRQWLKEGRLPFLTIFMAGVFAGMLLMNLGKSILLENTGLLDEYALYDMKYMTVDGNALFYYVLKERLGMVLLVAVLSTTYLGLAVCGGMTLWFGISTGALLATAVMRYGMKGILLVLVGVFPQYLIYVPAMILLLFWCQKLYRNIYLERSPLSPPRLLVQLLGLFLIFFVGCVLETFLNPYLLRGLLKVF